MARTSCFPVAGWVAMVFGKVRQSPGAEQPCLKGAGAGVYGVPEALSLPQPGVAFVSSLGGQKPGETCQHLSWCLCFWLVPCWGRSVPLQVTALLCHWHQEDEARIRHR